MSLPPIDPADDATGATASEAAEPASAGRRRLHPRVRNWIEWGVVLGGALIVAALLRAFLFQTFYIPSGSMIPSLVQGDRVIVNKLADDYHRGDILVFQRPESWQGQHDDLIKRLIGLPGETIEIKENTVFVDDEALDEPYLADDVVMTDFGPETVSEDSLFMMGDNRNFSSDSRVNGPVPESNVVGRAFLRIWPPGSFGTL